MTASCRIIRACLPFLGWGMTCLSAAAEIRPGSVKGHVVDAATRQPVEGANVVLSEGDRRTVTDAQGGFELSAVEAAVYSLRVERERYASVLRDDVVVRPARITFVEVELPPSVRRAEEVTVSAGPMTSPGQALGAAEFSAEEIRRAPGSGGDMSRALYVLPGVTQVDLSANDLVVRGGSPTENAFYIDNIPIANINHFPQEGASGGNINALNIDFIQDVRVLVGGFGAEWGDRLSSVVDIRLREGNRDEFDGQLDLSSAGVGGGLEGPLPGRKGSWMISARRSYLDLLSGTLGIDAAVDFADLQGKVVVDLSSRHRLSFVSLTGDSSGVRSHEDALTQGDDEGREDHLIHTSGVNWRALWGGAGFSETSLSWGVVDSKREWRNPTTGKPDDEGDYRDAAWSLRNVSSWQVTPTHRLQAGFQGSWRKGRGLDAGTQTWVDVDGLEGGGFASWHLSPGRVTGDLGVRVDYQPWAERVHVSPRAAGSLALGRRLTASAAFGVYHQRLPFFLMEQDPQNESLEDMRAIHYVTGLAWRPASHTLVSLEAYDKEYDREPMSKKAPERFVIDDVAGDHSSFETYGALVAEGEAYSRGVELLVRSQPRRGLHATLGAALSRCRYRDLNGVWHNRLYDNRHVVSALLGYRIGRGWELGGRFILAGGLATTPLDIEASRKANRTVTRGGAYMQGHLPSFSTLDLRVDRRFHFRRSSLAAYVSVWNVLDHDNVRREYWDSVTKAPAQSTQWGRLPILGLEYEF